LEEPGFRHNNSFEIIGEECKAVRERVGLLDLSSFAKYDVTGKDARALLNRISANKMSPRTGGISLTHYLSPTGRISGESTITRLSDEHYYVLSGAVAEDRDFDTLNQGILDGEEVQVKNISDEYGVLVLAGPRSRELLAQLTDTDLGNENFRWLSGQEISVAGVQVRALRVNYVGELGWELHVPMADMLPVYDALWAAGQEFGIANFGTYAVNSMRMEKAYKGWGSELTNEITMVEADLMRFFAGKKEQFTGKDATLATLESDISEQIVYLEVDSEDCDIAGGEPVFADGIPVGVTTSGGYGHATQKSLGFAYVGPKYAKVGTRLLVELLGQQYKAVVIGDPVWDAGAIRSRADH
jgi:dimethylglycine dehydrogenase